MWETGALGVRSLRNHKPQELGIRRLGSWELEAGSQDLGALSKEPSEPRI